MNNNGYDNEQNQNQNQNEKEEIRFNDWEIGNTFNRNDSWNPHVDYGTYSGNTRSNDEYTNNSSYYNSEPPMLIDEKKERRHFSRLGLGFALFTLISTIAALLICEIVLNINEQIYDSTWFMNLLSPVALYAFALPVLLIVVSGLETKRPQKSKLGFGKWILLLIVAFGFMYIGAMIGNGVMDRISEIMNHDYSNSLENIIDEENIWITAIFTVIVAPIGEELVFRKLIIDRTNKYGGVVCIVLSALIFGLMHGNFYQFFYCFGIGLILGYIYYSSGRILPCILIHAIVNFMGSIVPVWLTPILEKMESLDYENIDGLVEFTMNNLGGIVAAMAFSLFVYAAMALAIILPITLRKKIKLGKPETKLPRGRAMGIVIGGTGMIIMLVVYGLELVLSLIPY